MTQDSGRTIDPGHHRRRLKRRLEDPAFRQEYERARAEIRQVDGVIRALDHLREEAGFSKADLARMIGKDPAAIRRLFTAASTNPELKTVVSLATAMGAQIQVVPPKRAQRISKSRSTGSKKRTAASSRRR